MKERKKLSPFLPSFFLQPPPVFFVGLNKIYTALVLQTLLRSTISWRFHVAVRTLREKEGEEEEGHCVSTKSISRKEAAEASDKSSRNKESLRQSALKSSSRSSTRYWCFNGNSFASHPYTHASDPIIGSRRDLLAPPPLLSFLFFFSKKVYKKKERKKETHISLPLFLPFSSGYNCA